MRYIIKHISLHEYKQWRAPRASKVSSNLISVHFTLLFSVIPCGCCCLPLIRDKAFDCSLATNCKRPTLWNAVDILCPKQRTNIGRDKRLLTSAIYWSYHGGLSLLLLWVSSYSSSTAELLLRTVGLKNRAHLFFSTQFEPNPTPVPESPLKTGLEWCWEHIHIY